MISEKELHAILVTEIEMAGGVSAWARVHRLFKQRSNIDMMYQGSRQIGKKVAAKLGYKKTKTWELIRSKA